MSLKECHFRYHTGYGIIVNVDKEGCDADYAPDISTVYQIMGSKNSQIAWDTFDLMIRRHPC
jgi:hypothetical protein